LIAFGWFCHPIEVIGGESDQYVPRAEMLLQGSVPKDTFHPLLFPVLTAGLGLLVGDCFVAGRIVSSLAAGVFVFFAARLMGVMFGRVVSWISMCMVMVNSLVITFGVQAATDITWAALSTVTLYLAVRAAGRPGLAAALPVGVFFALSYFTRYTSTTLLPAILVALMLPRGLTGRQRILRIAAFSAAVLICLIPHFLLTYSAFGQILHDETWRPVAWKHYWNRDPRELFANDDFDGWLSVLRADPARIVSGVWRDAVDTTWIQVALQGSSPVSWIGRLLTLCCAAGAVASVATRRAPAMIGLLFLATYMAAIWLAVPPVGRQVLIVLPLCYGLVAHLVVKATRGRLAPTVLAGSALVIAVAAQTPGGISEFIEDHPIEEVETANQLVEQNGPVGLISSYLSMDRHFPYPTYFPIEVAGPDLDEFIDQIHHRVGETGAEYVLVGRATIGQPTFSLLRETALPQFLEVVRSDEDVLLLQVVGMDLEWFDTASAELDPDAGSIHLQTRLGPNAPLKQITGVVMVARSPGGITTLVPLEQVADGLYRAAVSAEPLEPGEWHLTPAAWDGERISRGDPILLTVR
jgi:hypothetical protein